MKDVLNFLTLRTQKIIYCGIAPVILTGVTYAALSDKIAADKSNTYGYLLLSVLVISFQIINLGVGAIFLRLARDGNMNGKLASRLMVSQQFAPVLLVITHLVFYKPLSPSIFSFFAFVAPFASLIFNALLCIIIRGRYSNNEVIKNFHS